MACIFLGVTCAGCKTRSNRAWGSGIGVINVDRRDQEAERPLRAPLVSNENIHRLRAWRAPCARYILREAGSSMIKLRRLIGVYVGDAGRDIWFEAALQEPPVAGRPKACQGCPLRRGGEWEKGASSAIQVMTQEQRDVVRARWGCHVEDRPCAGMKRIVSEVSK